MVENKHPQTEFEPANAFWIIRAGAGDTDAAWGIIKSCSDWLKTKGMDHWDKYYDKKMISKKIKDQQFFIAYQQGKAVGTVSLDTNPVDYYEEQDINSFAQPQATAVYITALAVHPESQGQGIAGKLMKFAEDTATQKGMEYVRFDCRESYADLVAFYKRRGYEKRGEIIDHEDNNERYLLMEKKL